IHLELADEAIAAAADGFDIPGRLRRIADRRPQLVDGIVQSVVEVDERIGGPEPEPQRLARDHLARPFEQRNQQLKRLFLQAQPAAAFPQFSRRGIDIEHTKPKKGKTTSPHERWFEGYAVKHPAAAD